MENTIPAGKMQGIFKKASKIFQQTRALLWKNILLVWRMKAQSFQEWVTASIFLLVLRESAAMIWSYPRQEFPYKFLGQLDDPAFNATGTTLMYTPGTNATRRIMGKVASDSVLRGVILEEMENVEKMEAKGNMDYEVIGVVFKDDFSYSLRFQFGKAVFPNEVTDHIESCWDFAGSYCKIPSYWYDGFLSVQSSIDAALIEMKTNHSVWKEMKSITGVFLKSPMMKPVFRMDYVWFIFCAILCYSPFMYFLSVKVLREKKKLKVLMRAMGLQDIAFWLSWSLLYTVYISISASLLALITLTDVLDSQSFSELYFFYFLYGMACIHFTFMISSLLKQPNITSFVGFLLHILLGSVGFLTLLDVLPPSAGWILNLFSPFAFTSGLSTMVKLDKHGPPFNPELYPLYNLYLILSLDSILYFLLAIYFDKVLPGKYGVPHPPAFFLRPSYWVKPSSGDEGLRGGSESNHEPLASSNAEPMPPGFGGKEAIRLNNIKKIYKKKGQSIEDLKGLSLNIYEGQITALLGHSGSGKTALLNVLSGFSKPSAGSATIYNYNISEILHREGIQAMVGVCPQLNLHFEALTVKENLQTFAHIKGTERKEVEQEVQKVLVMLDLTDLQNVCADALSGGQKRKLSLGIAVLGNPQVLLLDEPTAGLDPWSRHHVWSLLRERQAGHVTLFTTQSMEEADAHADRKAFLSNGKLQSVGSSLYLKRKWGIGYHLRVHINDLCDPELISSLVRQYIPDAVLKGKKRDELCYLLPLENTDSFPDLFSHLESSLLQGVVNYEVTRTTLEDVFLKLEGEEIIDGEGDGDLEEKDQNPPVFSKQGILPGNGMVLWRQQVCAVMRVRLLKLKHDGKFLRAILLFFGTFILPLLMLLIVLHLWHSSGSWEITASPYFLPTKEKIQNKSSNLLILNDTGSEIEDFIAALRSQNIMPEITLEKNITRLPHHNGAIKISLEGKRYQFTVLCSPEPVNCYPLLMNIISNSLLRLRNSTARIRVWSELFPRLQTPDIKNYIFFNCLDYLLLLAAGLPPLFAVSSTEDYKLQARSQLRHAGLFPSAYWCGQALVDIPLYWILFSLMFGILVLITRTCPLQADSVLPLIICIIGYGASLVLLVYLIAFKFLRRRSNRYIWVLIFILVNYAAYMISDYYGVFYYIFNLIPVFPLLGCVMFFRLSFIMSHNDETFHLWNHVYMAVFAPYIHCIIFTLLLRCLEMRCGEPVTRFDPIFRIQPRRVVTKQNKDPAGEEPPEVQAERERVRSAMVSLQQDEESIVINSLRKEYEVKKATSIFKKKKKLAVKNLSFSVKKGEVLGLLGPSGAGKSTTINMISGDVAVTAGEVLLREQDGTAPSPGLVSLGGLGCCPQQDPLWPDLTVLQHLEAFAAVRGMRKEDAALTIASIAKALDLLKHFKTPARKLLAGEARKLSFALSILGDPAVMLWDEPSAGMDLKGQRHMWRMMQSCMRSRERAAILSTQHLEEVAAMCDRVAILVSGRLRYIGSLEGLKSKFCTSYHLEIRLTDTAQSDVLHAEILKLFPCAARQERTSSLLIYKIPMADALPLSQSFSKLEAAKQNFRFEEYSLSLNTLQQIFVDIIRDAEEHDLDAASNRAVEQRLLHP